MTKPNIHPAIKILKDYKYLVRHFDTGYMRKIDRYFTVRHKGRMLLVNSFHIDSVLEADEDHVLRILDIFSEPIAFLVFLERLGRTFHLDLSKSSRGVRNKVAELLSDVRTLIKYKFIVPESYDEYAELSRLRTILASRLLYVDNVYVIPTLGCNFRCPQCFIYEGTSKAARKGMMSPSLFDRQNGFIMQVLRKDISTDIVYTLYGGEPLLNRKLVEHVFKTVRKMEREGAYGKRRVGFAMVTNGSMIDEEVAAMLGEYDVNLGVSIDGVKRIHDARKKLPNGGGTFDLVMDGIRCLERAGVHYGLSWTIGPDNIDSASKDIDWVARNMKTRAIYFNYQMDAAGKSFANIKPEEFFRKMHRIYDKLESRGFRENRYMMYRRAGRNRLDIPPFPYNCSAVNGGQFVLRPDGKVGICSADIVHGTKAWQDIENIKNYKEDPAFMAWIGRTPIEMKRCYSECDYFGLCSGGCAYFTERVTGSAYEPSPVQCMFERFMIERAIIEDYGSA